MSETLSVEMHRKKGSTAMSNFIWMREGSRPRVLRSRTNVFHSGSHGMLGTK